MDGFTAVLVVILLLAVAFITLVFSNAICQPHVGEGAMVRMANRARREIEQMLYGFVSVCVLGAIVVAFYAIFGS